MPKDREEGRGGREATLKMDHNDPFDLHTRDEI